MAEPTVATVSAPCCICDATVCAADESGDHCIDRSCAYCLHGCPAGERPCCLVPSDDLDARLNALLIECGRQERAIYSGAGVSPNEALPFITRVARLVEGLCGVTSLDTYDDVIDALEDAV